MIKKGDLVQILIGKDRGKKGKVLRVDIKKEKVLIDGLNLYKKHSKPKRQGEKGEIIDIPRPLHISNVGFFCSACKKTVRLEKRIENKNKIRVCRKCKANVN